MALRGRQLGSWLPSFWPLASACFWPDRYYLRLDVDAPDDEGELDQPPWRFAPYFAARRRQLGVLALLGLAISLIRLGALCFGLDWPGRWATWPLVIGLLGLFFIQSKIAKPNTPLPIPKWASRIQGAALYALLVFALLSAWRGWPGKPMDVIATGVVAVWYASEALQFAYGELRPKQG